MNIKPQNLILIPILIIGLGFLPKARAVSPAPDGGYPGGNTAEGQAALFSLTTGGFNTAVGFLSLRSNVTGQLNTAIGAGTLLSNAADSGTAIGAGALLSNTVGEENTATGAFALFSNTEGDFNNANGSFALFANTTGERNTATGDSALYSNTTGYQNTATGNAALVVNTTGNGNTANGAFALSGNTTGQVNTATGGNALPNNTTGNSNTAIGVNALLSNTDGDFNTANGVNALFDNTTGSANTVSGYRAGFAITGNGNVCIGAVVSGTAGVNDTTWIRNVYDSAASARQVYVNVDNKIGTLSSSRRYKDEIRPMAKASEAIFSLRPVIFHYKKEVDPTSLLSFGLIAEEVAEVDPDLVTPDRDGRPETVRYEAVNAMLLNEFLKAHAKLEQQQATIEKQQKQIQALISGLQKVSDQLELKMPSARTADNH